jgi:type III secretion system FlhB-like substrate exporter
MSKPRVGGGREFRERAIALKYVPELPAPFIVAKGEGRAAERLKKIARDAGVPILEEENLVDLLFPDDIGTLVPIEFYEIVAKVFAWVRTSEG